MMFLVPDTLAVELVDNYTYEVFERIVAGSQPDAFALESLYKVIKIGTKSSSTNNNFKKPCL